MHNIVNRQNANESYTLKWLILCYLNFTSVKKIIIIKGADISQHIALKPSLQ